MKKDPEVLAKQVAGTMAIEGMELEQSEYDQLVRCAAGQQSISETIKKMISKYTDKG